MKKDKYLRARGGTAKMLDIRCAKCGTWILKYQKDGVGQLLRCYFNRIFTPPKLVMLQNDPTIKKQKDVPNLVCPKCNIIIGIPMRHKDDRFAYRLMKGTYTKKIVKGE